MIRNILRFVSKRNRNCLIYGCLSSRRLATDIKHAESSEIIVPDFMEFHGNWQEDIKKQVITDMHIIENFITQPEEDSLMEELEPYLKRLHYEKDHWDDAIAVYRETERKQWYPKNKEIIQRLISRAFVSKEGVLPHVHVLDLAADGYIKAHVDSVRFCGNTIAGLSLLTHSVMKLVQSIEDDKEDDGYRKIPVKNNPPNNDLYSVNVLLKRHSCYIMKDSARYKFTHEILKNDESIFKGKQIQKDRRISIICRNEPE